jgi:hypothetical protein
MEVSRQHAMVPLPPGKNADVSWIRSWVGLGGCRIRNTYWFYTATMVTRTRFNVTSHVYCPPCYKYWQTNPQWVRRHKEDLKLHQDRCENLRCLRNNQFSNLYFTGMNLPSPKTPPPLNVWLVGFLVEHPVEYSQLYLSLPPTVHQFIRTMLFNLNIIKLFIIVLTTGARRQYRTSRHSAEHVQQAICIDTHSEIV